MPCINNLVSTGGAEGLDLPPGECFVLLQLQLQLQPLFIIIFFKKLSEQVKKMSSQKAFLQRNIKKIEIKIIV